MNIIYKFTEKVVKNYKTTLILILIISIPMLYYFLQQRHYNDFRIYFEKDNPDILLYENFKKIYGNEEFVIVTINDENIFTNENFKIIREISGSLKKLEGVQRIFSITNYKEPVSINNSIKFLPIIPGGELSSRELKILKSKILNNRSLVDSIISKTGKLTSIIIELESEIKSDKKNRLFNDIITNSTKINNNRASLHFAGLPFIESELNRLSKKDVLIFSPLVFLIISIIIIILLKVLRLAFLCQLNLLLALIWSIGLFVLCGETFNIVTIIMIPVILAISIADSVHILSHYKEIFKSNGNNHVNAVRDAISYLWLPCLFTSITTAVGFISFQSSTVMPVKTVGIFTAIGIMLAFFLTVTFLPSILILARKKIVKSISHFKETTQSADAYTGKYIPKILGFTSRISTTYIKSIFIIFIIVMLLSLVGILKLKYESSALEYLPDDNMFKSDMIFIDENLGGSIPIVVLIKAKDRDFTHPESVKFLENIENEIMKDIKYFSFSSSITEYLRQTNKAFNDGREEFYKVPVERNSIIEFYEVADADMLDRFIGPGYKEARISFLSRIRNNIVGNQIIDYLNKYLAQKTGDAYSFKITGRSPLSLAIGKNLKISQIRSLASALIIIFIMMIFVCRNFTLSLLCMIPNIFPIALTLGIMGWIGLPLDVATIMISSITIGIAVDDTIHFIVAFKRNIGTIKNRKEAILKSMKDAGKPIIITSIILFLGFFSLILGNILPTKTFGVLTALAMLFALIGDIIIMPALILIFKPRVTPILDNKNISTINNSF